ncbi:MAG TPA: GAF domain-containing sensor histidine kinase [Acidimicrobiia bacterium]|jgi:signal transduction histidine kinase
MGTSQVQETRVLADEQAALRRVATLVARGTQQEDVFTAVIEEVGRLFPIDLASLCRYESDGSLTWLASWGRAVDLFPAGTRRMLGGNNLGTIVFETGHSARIDSYAESSSGPIGVDAKAAGINSSLATPIMVEGRLWGVIAAGSLEHRPLPPDAETRLANFTELVATAIANSESRAGLAQLAQEQAALRRVATLVAYGVPPEVMFSAVTGEVGKLLSVEYAGLSRFEPDGAVTVVAGSGTRGDRAPVGRRWRLGGTNVSTLVFETGHSARIDGSGDASPSEEISSGVGTPVVVDGRLWGVMEAYSSMDAPLPADTEARLASFTDLLATAIANAESRAALTRLAEEQAALRRVATLVAQGAAPEAVFAAVTEEIGHLLPVDSAAMGRFAPDGTQTYVASWGRAVGWIPVGSQWKTGGRNIGTLVFETGRPVRIDDYADASGMAADIAREQGIRSSVGTPIIVEGRLWGSVGAASSGEAPLPADSEARLASFTDLLATAISNAETRAELAASRTRIVAAGDETRKRIERDLHDGTQQRLVSLVLELGAVQAAMPFELGALERRLGHVSEELTRVFEELRELSHGIHPAILSKGGLVPALRSLGRRSAIPMELESHAEGRLPEPVEVAAYYVVSEALTNAAKHAHASVVHVDLDARGATLRLAVRDDGIGGADSQGSGLLGLSDRIEALGGTLQVTSRAGKGTALLIEIPLDAQGDHP